MGRTCGCDDCQTSRGRRKEFRQSAGMPEDEIPRGHPKGKNKKRHVHHYVRFDSGFTTTYRDKDRVVPKYVYVCQGCGNRNSYGDIYTRRYYF